MTSIQCTFTFSVDADDFVYSKDAQKVWEYLISHKADGIVVDTVLGCTEQQSLIDTIVMDLVAQICSDESISAEGSDDDDNLREGDEGVPPPPPLESEDESEVGKCVCGKITSTKNYSGGSTCCKCQSVTLCDDCCPLVPGGHAESCWDECVSEEYPHKICLACAAPPLESEGHIIYIQEDGETWSDSAPTKIRLTDAEYEEVRNGLEPRKLEGFYEKTDLSAE